MQSGLCEQSDVRLGSGPAEFKSAPAVRLRQPVWRPDENSLRDSQMAVFIRYCEARTGRSFRSYESFRRFSVDEYREFWRYFLDWSGLRYAGDSAEVCTDDRIEQASFFPALRLNYAQALLADAVCPAAAPALRSCHADGSVERLTRAELAGSVMAGARALKTLGFDSGCRAALVAFNDAVAVTAALSVAAIGGSIGTSAPEMGAAASIARLGAIAPDLLICHARTPHGGGDAQFGAKLSQIVRELPSLRAVILLDSQPPLMDAGVPCHAFAELSAPHRGLSFEWPLLPFNHPLFILFSSGTTGAPKAIVHGAGGTLIEHLKEHRLHCDLKPGDRMFFQTSTAWMMWNWSLSALASGAELVLYDGAVSPDTLWNIVAAEQVTVFGTGPAYLQMSERAGIAPREKLDLAALRAVMSTGSILHEQQQTWFTRQVKDLPVQSISGGTDIIGCFVMGNPILPAYAAEAQCIGLGFDVRAFRAEAAPTENQVGELVCARPFPSRPLGFLQDPDSQRFHQAYFAENPGFWTHGDLIEVTSEAGVVMHGRSDGTMNIRGIRVGPAEIYRVLQDFPEVAEALAVEQRADDEVGHARIVLLLVLRPGFTLDSVLQGRMRRAIAHQASAAHVPAVILRVDELPATHTGKLSERSARDAVNRRPVSNNGALRNPDCLAAIAAHPGLVARRDIDAGPQQGLQLIDEDGRISEAALTRLWEEALGISPIASDEDFFDLGADSLAALGLLLSIEQSLGITLPITFIYEAPTIARMAARLEMPERPRFSHLVPIKDGGPEPPFHIVHGLGGGVIELFRLGRLLDYDGPVCALQPRGLDGQAEPFASVEAMAAAYVEAIRARQSEGPFRLCGYSFGGLVAFEMARRLRADGYRVEPLILLDTGIDERYWPKTAWLRVLTTILAKNLRELRDTPARQLVPFLVDGVRGLWRHLRLRFGNPARSGTDLGELDLPSPLRRVREAAEAAMSNYRPGKYDGDVVLMRCAERDPFSYDAAPLWASLSRKLAIHEVPGNHLMMVRDPSVRSLAAAISRCLPGGLKHCRAGSGKRDGAPP